MKNTYDQPNEDYLAIIGFVLFGALLGLSLFLPWQWSILMDETSYLHSLNQLSFLETVKSQFWSYWNNGRFYPLKMLFNVIEWRWFPLNPKLFHIIHTAIAITTLSAGWFAIRHVEIEGKERLISFKYIGLFFCSAILAKPFLDSLQFLSLGETWATLFFSFGALCLVKGRYFAARLFWILAALCKEPMAGVFLSSFVYTLLCWKSLSIGKKRIVSLLMMDIILFLTMASVAYMAMNRGTYLSGYSLFSLSSLKGFVFSLARLSLFLSPLLVLTGICFFKLGGLATVIKSSPKVLAWNLFLFSFTFGYLYLVTAQNSSGYLQIPVGFAALLILFPFALRGWHWVLTKSKAAVYAFIAFWIFISLFSLNRWATSTHGVNEVSLVFRELTRTTNPRLILVNGPEVSEILRHTVAMEGWVNVKILHTGEFDPNSLDSFEGEVLVLDPVRYFGGLPGTTLETYEKWAGGWKYVSSLTDSYRIYYANRKK